MKFSLDDLLGKPVKVVPAKKNQIEGSDSKVKWKRKCCKCYAVPTIRFTKGRGGWQEGQSCRACWDKWRGSFWSHYTFIEERSGWFVQCEGLGCKESPEVKFKARGKKSGETYQVCKQHAMSWPLIFEVVQQR